MKFQITILLLSLIGTSLIFSQQKKITIKVDVDNLPENSSVYITGNTDELGNWLFDIKKPMEKISAKEWGFETTGETGDTLQFKFTLGSWRTEAVDSNGIEYPNFVYVVTKDTSLVYTIPRWRDMVQQKIIISKERLDNKAGIIDFFENWKYRIGDDSVWADPNFDDSEWETINPMLPKKEFEKLNWTGNIWFRNNIIVDSSLWNKPLGLVFFCTGAAEIFLDGKLINKYGEVGDSKISEVAFIERSPRYIIFNESETHVIAVRYSNFLAEEIIKYDIPAGFYAVIGELNMFISNRVENVRQNSIIQMAFSAFILAFSIMHLLLFVFYPKARENLFYSISMLSFAIVIYMGIQGDFVHSIMAAIDITIINSISVETAIFFGLLTVYASTYTKMPKQSIFFLVFWALFVLIAIFDPLLGGNSTEYAFYIYALILSLEILRVVIRSVIRKDPWGWGWIIGVGFIVAILLIAYQVLILTDIITQPLFGIRLVYVYGIVFLAVTVSINLSKKVSDTNKDLEKQLVNVKELSQKTIEQERKAREEEIARKLLQADNDRKTKELEEARKLQLSMLPDKIPNVSGLDISVYMKPATEVGGDYYDFKYNNGSLLIAIGDATGHGMRAGTMVATIKGLFTAENFNSDIVSFLNKSNTVIRDMNLGNLFMAMLIAKIDGNKVTLSSAGMPPALIYRSKDKTVEEFRLQALPLGGTDDFKYSQKNTSIEPGDTLLLMSDGFPELFNAQKEILDYDRAKEIFGSVAEFSPHRIVNKLCQEADTWQGGAHQEDDITFVVVKVNRS